MTFTVDVKVIKTAKVCLIDAAQKSFLCKGSTDLFIFRLFAQKVLLHNATLFAICNAIIIRANQSITSCSAMMITANSIASCSTIMIRAN